METPNYDEFKRGIKRDVNNAVTNYLFSAGIVLWLIVIILTGIFLISKYSPFGNTGKIITGIVMVALIVTKIFNKKVGNAIILIWLRLLIIIPTLAVGAFAAWFIYVIFKEGFRDFFLK